MDIAELQVRIAAAFGARDRARGPDGTFRRLVEEVGEVAKALRGGDRTEIALELADVVAWTVSVAILYDVDLDRALGRYGRGCPRCEASPCCCPEDGGAR